MDELFIFGGFVLTVATASRIELKPNNREMKREELIHFLDSIRDYEKESHNMIGFDERESGEIVDVYLQDSSLTPSVKESLTVEPKDNDWRLVGHSSQVADTGDYDGYYEITNGKISLLTKDDDKEALQPVVDAFNNSGCRFYQDDWFEFENKVLKDEIRNLQSIAAVEPMTAEEFLAKRNYDPTLAYPHLLVVQLMEEYASRPTVAEREVGDE